MVKNNALQIHLTGWSVNCFAPFEPQTVVSHQRALIAEMCQQGVYRSFLRRAAVMQCEQWWKKHKGGQGVYPISSSFLFWSRASINFTSICRSFGRKVRAAPTNTKGKHSADLEKHTVAFHFEQTGVFFPKKRTKIEYLGLVKQTVWDSVVLSTSPSSLQTHNPPAWNPHRLVVHAQKRKKQKNKLPLTSKCYQRMAAV